MKTEPELFTSIKAYEARLGEMFASVLELARSKGAEYARGANRLDNFTRAAADLDLLPEQVWRVYAQKHWDALGQYIRDVAEGKERPRSEPLQSRVLDLIVYLTLFDSMVSAREAAKLAAQKLSDAA